MKLQIGSLFLLIILLSATSVTHIAAADVDRASVKMATVNFRIVDNSSNRSKIFEVCEVVTKVGNLNVRASTKNNSNIIAKLRNGTKVNVISRGDYISRIAVQLKGKLVRGWVSNDYLGNCYA